MKVKSLKFLNATRTVRVALTFEDNDERQTEEFAVKYRSFSPKVAREMEEAESDENNRSLAKSLAKIVVSIPDIVSEDEQPIAITEDSLSEFSGDNLTAIYKSILRDINPTQPLPTSIISPSTSEAVEAQA